MEAEKRCCCPDVLVSALCIFLGHQPRCLAVALSPGAAGAPLVVALPGDTLPALVAVGSGRRRHASGCGGSATRGEARAALRERLCPRSTGTGVSAGGLQRAGETADLTWICWVLAASSSGSALGHQGRSMGWYRSFARNAALLG